MDYDGWVYYYRSAYTNFYASQPCCYAVCVKVLLLGSLAYGF